MLTQDHIPVVYARSGAIDNEIHRCGAFNIPLLPCDAPQVGEQNFLEPAVV